MYEPNYFLREPPDETPLWRYMDFARFFSVLEYKALYFPCVTTLEDPFEGHPTRSMVDEIPNLLESAGIQDSGELRETVARVEADYQRVRNLVFVSCWHANPNESEAMWKLYAGSGAGVAIRSTFARFKAAFSAAPQVVQGGVVNYIDYDLELNGSGSLLGLACQKRLSFQHEREFRGLVMDTSHASGLSVRCDVGELIESIYLSPTMKAWERALIEKMLTHRYQSQIPVHVSNLANAPRFYGSSK